jgi:hypothetical protein
MLKNIYTSKMGACFSKPQDKYDDAVNRLRSNPQYVESMSALDRLRYEKMYNPPQGTTAQTSLGGGGGCAGGIRYQQPPAGQKLKLATECAFITKDRRIVMVRESASNTWNFPYGDRNDGESLDTSIHRACKKLGFYPFVHNCVTRNSTFVNKHTSKSTGRITQTTIYVYEHACDSSWFKRNFQSNNECSAIILISIEDFKHYVRNNSELFGFPESMAGFAAATL